MLNLLRKNLVEVCIGIVAVGTIAIVLLLFMPAAQESSLQAAGNTEGNLTNHSTQRMAVRQPAPEGFEVPPITQAIQTIFPTKDWVISDFIVTDFGARAEPGFDNREAFQDAINAAHRAGGGVVFVPAGNYEFRSTSSRNTPNLRLRDGTNETTGNFTYNYVLRLPQSVQLRGDWANPQGVDMDGNPIDGRVLGTILEVHVGRGNGNETVQTWWNDPQAGGALRSTYTNISDRFIELNEGTGITNLSIWYPNQHIDNIVPYPWTLFQTRGNSATIENVTLVNSYLGFHSAPSELHYVLNTHMTALNTGIAVHICTDIGRIESVRITPEVWAASGLPGAPPLAAVRDYTRTHGTGFMMHRSDWEYVYDLYVSGYNIGMWVGREPGFNNAPNAQFFRLNLTDNATGLFVQDVNPYGLLISNSVIGGDIAVYFSEYFRTSVQFNGVEFLGPVVSDGIGGVISFEHAVFNATRGYTLQINSGNVLLTQSEFLDNARHVNLQQGLVRSLNSGSGNVAHNRTLRLTTAAGQSEVINGEEFLLPPMPTDIRTNIPTHPRPPTSNVIRADLTRVTTFNAARPMTDISAQLQAILDAMADAGGGTVFLPGGRYLVNHPIIVPTGVELRGSWDVQHHTQSGGTAIFTGYTGGEAGEDGASLIQLEAGAGLRGLKVVQANLIEGGDFSTTNPRRAPFLIQGTGRDVYIINVTISLGDKGIDLFTYDTSGHYVDYFAGVLMRAGIWVGGGAEGGFIRNMQLNPHYAQRHPEGGQGYPMPDNTDRAFFLFLQGNLSALRFGDVRNQVIFNNFVFGSVYGIHFVRDEITGNYPGEIIVVGHGSDGCTFALHVEEAGADTHILAINSQLVNTNIADQPVRAYVRVGDVPNTPRIHPESQLVLQNTSFWGSPTVGAIINNGIVRFHQANFSVTGQPGVDVRGGQAHVYSTFFAQARAGVDNNAHVRLHPAAEMVELSNNFYTGGMGLVAPAGGRVFGSDVR